jgi:hypothetical protein
MTAYALHTIEDTFNRMMDVLASLDVGQQRAVQEGLSKALI